MIEITKEQVDRLCKKEKRQSAAAIGGMMVCLVIAFILVEFNDSDNPAITLAGVLLLVLGIALPLIWSKRVTPAGFGKKTRELSSILQQDFTTQNAINVAYDRIGRTQDFAEKTVAMLYLCDIHNIRGELAQSISLLNSIDRLRFRDYPTVGLTYYGEVMETYSLAEDNKSVIAAFADAEPFIGECAFRNINCCSQAISIMKLYEKAQGNYSEALRLQLLYNDTKNRSVSGVNASAQQTPLVSFLRGSIFLDTAELFYLTGNAAEAGKYLDIGGPMLSASAYATDRANKLSDKIRASLSGKGAGT